MPNTYRKNIITITVLSNRPLGDMTLGDIFYETDAGDMVMGNMDVAVIHLDKDQMKRQLRAANSDDTFFDDYLEELEP